MRDMWTATYVPRRALLEFLGSLLARSVEHTSSSDKLVPVIVIAIWLQVMTQVVFGTAGIGRAFIRLLRACFHIRFHIWIGICYVSDLVCLRKIIWGTLMCGSWCGLHFLR